MSGEVKVDPGQVNAHTNVIDAAAKTLEQAKAASEHIRLGSEAYGLLCAALPVMIAELHEDFNDVLDKLKLALENNAASARTAVADIKTTDTDNAIDLDKVAPR